MLEKDVSYMNFSKKLDRLGSQLAHSQAMIFERSVEEGYPSKMFVKCFMFSSEAKSLDELSLEKAGLSEIEIYDSIKHKIKSKRGQLLPYLVMHFIGYFYRVASYISGFSSKQLYKQIPVEFLLQNYLVLHSLDIEEAVKEVFDIKKIEKIDLYEQFKNIYGKY